MAKLVGVFAASHGPIIARDWDTMPRDHRDPAALGRSAAKMLLSSGAGALLKPFEGAAR